MLSFSAEDGRKNMVPLARNGRGFGWDKTVKFKKNNAAKIIWKQNEDQSSQMSRDQGVEDTSIIGKKNFL